MTDVAAKSAKQIAHEQRNAERKADKAQRRVDKFLAHVERQNQSAVEAAARRAARAAQKEEAALADATLAYAAEIEARYGIAANDNASIAKAA